MFGDAGPWDCELKAIFNIQHSRYPQSGSHIIKRFSVTRVTWHVIGVDKKAKVPLT